MKKLIQIYLILTLNSLIIYSQGNFSSQQIISNTFDYANCVKTADIDGDGDLDVISSSQLGNKVAWFENLDANTSFGSENVISNTESKPYYIAVEDFDGDGDKDVATASSASDKITWYKNSDGHGTFILGNVITSNADQVNCLYAADFENDGDIDIVSSSYGDNKIALYKNTGNGTFETQIISTSAQGAYYVYGADLDGDLDLDIISASKTDSKIAWYKNKDGNFSSEIIVSSSLIGAQCVVASDIEKDGDLDLVCSAVNTDKLVYFLNNNGTFGTENLITTNLSDPKDLKCDDIDNDGDNDLVVAAWGSDEILWYDNIDNTGNFSAKYSVSNLADGADDVCLSDIDNDGDLDILSASNYDDKVAFYLNNINGDAVFCDITEVQDIGSNAIAIFAADLDNDDDLDLISASNYDDKISWHQNIDGFGNFDTEIIITDSFEKAYDVFADDIDIDNDLDIIAVSSELNKIIWFENISNTFTTQHEISSNTNGFYQIKAFDIDNDGDKDIICKGSENLSWFENTNGLGTFSTEHLITTRLHMGDFYIADLNGDGNLDIVAASYDRIEWFMNDGTGNLTDITIESSIEWGLRVFCADMDNDGDLDIVAAIGTGDNLCWYENTDGNGTFGEKIVIASYIEGTIAHIDVSDLNNDGFEDVIFSTESEISFFKNIDGEGNFEDKQIINSDYYAVDFCTDDIDSDNDLDIAFAYFWGGVIMWLKNCSYSADNQAPVITSYPDEQFVNADENCGNVLIDYTQLVTAEDNLDESLEMIQTPSSGTIIYGNLNLVTITVRDDAGNYDQVSFYVNVVDNTAPECIIENQQVYSNNECYSLLPDYTITAIVSDNCDNDVEIVQNPSAGTQISGITNNVTLTLTDDNNNISEFSFNVSVIDTISPVFITVFEDQTINANENCQAYLPDFTQNVLASDNCDDVFTFQQIPEIGTTIEGNSNTVTVRITDNSANFSEQSFNIEVIDNSNPVIVCADDTIRVNLADGQESYTVNGTEFDPTYVDDNCGVASFSNNLNNLSTLDNYEFMVGSTSVVWTVTDYSGFSSYCFTEIIVNGANNIDKFSEITFNIYPNPTNSILFIQIPNLLNSKIIKDINLFDISGKEVLKIGDNLNQSEIKIDLSELSNGIYFIEINTIEQVFYSKIIKQ